MTPTKPLLVLLLSLCIAAAQAPDATAATYTARPTVPDDAGTAASVTPMTIVRARPSVTATSPADGDAGVRRDIFVSAEVHLPNSGQGIDGSTLTASTVKLYRSSNPAAVVQANLNTSGGGDVIVLQPTSLLAANTAYTFEVTAGLKDMSGASFQPFKMSFTTGSLPDGSSSSSIQFEKVALSGTTGRHTTVTIGPDGKLYALTNTGVIKRWNINPDGTLSNLQTINSLRNSEGGDRLAVGLVFDPSATATNLIAWVSHTTYGFNSMPDWGGKITRLSGPNLGIVKHYLKNLPRSIRDHVTNSLAFGPDGALYVCQGSNTAMGAPDDAWGNRPERKLSGAVLRVDVAALAASGSLPLNVKTEAGGSYNPYAPGAKVKIFASGVRNAYDLVWHSNENLYVPTNGSAAGGNAPASVNGTKRPDRKLYSGPDVPAIEDVRSQNDFLFRVPPPRSDGTWGYRYYGHPNPTRGEYVLNGGNPTSSVDRAEVTEYPVGIHPDVAWKGYAFNFGQHFSPNGAVEYKSNTFNGGLKGKLLVVRYSGGDDIIVLTPNATNGDISSGGAEAGITGFSGFTDPLDLTENPAKGHIYVSEYGGTGKITLLRPIDTTNDFFAESGGRVVIEAENYHGIINRGSHSWVMQAQTGSVGSSMQATPDNGANLNTGYATTSPELQYQVSFTKTGTYYVWGRVWGVNKGGDLFHAGLGGQELASSDRITASTRGSWVWTNKTMDNGARAALQVASAGVQTVNVWMREDGLYFDRLLLTTDPSYTPSGSGPAESPRTGSTLALASATSAELASEEEAPVNQQLAKLVALGRTPDQYALHGNYPNPFNSGTTIRFDIAEPAHVILEIYDVLGRRVTTLINESMEPGTYSAEWDGRNAASQAMAGGIYIYRIRAGSFHDSKVMTLLK